MSGREIENLLALIDDNMSANDHLLRSDVMAYLSSNQDLVLKQLRDYGKVTIPSSLGEVTIDLAQLQAAVA